MPVNKVPCRGLEDPDAENPEGKMVSPTGFEPVACG